MERRYSEVTSLDELELLEQDPYITDMFEYAREACKSLSLKGEATKEDLARVVAELDSNWAYHDRLCNVTGNVLFFDKSSGERERKYVEDTTMQSQGFYLLPQCISLDEDDRTFTYEPVLGWLLEDSSEQAEDSDSVSTRLFFTQLDEAIIDYPGGSLQAIYARLEHFHPQTLTKLDHIIKNFNNKNHKISAFSETCFELSESNNDDMSFRSDIEMYINTQIEFENDLPYVLEAKGLVLLDDIKDDEPTLAKAQLKGYFTPSSLRLYPHPETLTAEADVKPYILYVHGKFHGTTPDEDVILQVPVSHASRFYSIRQGK